MAHRRLKAIDDDYSEEMRELRAGMLRAEHPDWAPEQISRALRDFVLNARS